MKKLFLILMMAACLMYLPIYVELTSVKIITADGSTIKPILKILKKYGIK